MTNQTPAEILSLLLMPDGPGRADPYPLYAALHEQGPAVDADGIVMVPGYDAASAVLRDPAFKVHDASSYDVVMPDWREHPSMIMDSLLSLNEPAHARIRRLLTKGFTARRVAGLEPAIAAMADRLLDDLAERGHGGRPVEFMHDFAFLLPVTVICELIGIPEADRERFRPLARDLVATLEPVGAEQLAAADAATAELRQYFAVLARERRADPRDDLMSALVGINDSGDGRLTDDELLDNLTLLLVAGFETTVNLLGNGLRIVLADPIFGEDVLDGVVTAGEFVEEVLRYDSPVQLTSRHRPDESEVAGLAVAPDTEVIVMLGAANRDPARFNEPNRFNPARSGPGPLSFGGGLHFCLGAALARLEAAVAFPRILSRFPRIAAAGDPVRRNGLVLRGFDTLPVVLD